MTDVTRAGDLAARARRWFERHPEARGELTGPSFGRPWDHYLDRGAAEIEELRERFPADRLSGARSVLALDPRWGRPRRPGTIVGDLTEQVYRAHYSSLKIGHSWSLAVSGAVALAHLLGGLDAEEVEAWMAHDRPAEDSRQTEATTLRFLADEVWPREGLAEPFAALQAEGFHGHIPLRSGVFALGLRLVLYDYACEVVTVLTRLHRNTAYTYGLCAGRTLSYPEAMVLKTLPEPPGAVDG